MSRADDGSKFPDTCNYQLDPRQLQRIERALGITHTCDVFAATSNALLPRFFSRHGCLGRAHMPADALAEFRLWRTMLPSHTGSAISAESPRARIVLSADAGDTG